MIQLVHLRLRHVCCKDQSEKSRILVYPSKFTNIVRGTLMAPYGFQALGKVLQDPQSIWKNFQMVPQERNSDGFRKGQLYRSLLGEIMGNHRISSVPKHTRDFFVRDLAPIRGSASRFTSASRNKILPTEKLSLYQPTQRKPLRRCNQ